MNDNINGEATRPRPLSGGIWTLFSWLRRDDRSISSESLSSAGSDRTAVSFAFLEPFHYSAATEPIVLPPLSPPTDSYKKRVRDRNFRRQRERDITLHRKYGLLKDENTDRYDAFSLPTGRKNLYSSSDKIERGRRAASESFQRRAPYVPGKRRAPLPPAVTTSLPRSFSRKRPAPPPPNKLTVTTKENIQVCYTRFESMNSKPACDRRSLPNNNMDMKIDKYKKDEKIKHDKSFLKQIFDNRKRNSTCETNYVKLLPNISELDKQAAKIIEDKKLLSVAYNTKISNNGEYSKNLLPSEATRDNTWICTQCFMKHSSETSSCFYCRETKPLQSNKLCRSDLNHTENVSNIYTQTDNNLINVASSSKVSGNEEKNKLKEMLKEMKDSLPKRPKHNIPLTESPTLRIGSTSSNEKSIVNTESPSNNDKLSKSSEKLNSEETSISPSKRTLNVSSTETNDIIQPSSSGMSAKNPLKTFSSHLELKNTNTNCELSFPKQTDLEKYVQPSNSNKEIIKKREFNQGSQSTVTNKIFNIPVNNINPTNTTQCYIKEHVFNSVLESKNAIMNTETEIVTKEKNNDTHCQSVLQQKTSMNVLNTQQITCAKPKHSDLSNKEERRLDKQQNISKLSSDTLVTSVGSLVEKSTTKVVTENNNVNKKSSFVENSLSVVTNHVRPTEIVALDENKLNLVKLKTTVSSSVDEPSIHTPLKISSLLNPSYRPIQVNCVSKETLQNGKETSQFSVTSLTSSAISQQLSKASINLNPLQTITEICETSQKEPEQKEVKKVSYAISNQYNTNASVCKVLGVTPSSSKDRISHSNDVGRQDHHRKRRELVNQLEQSIAKGDEQAAADAAIKLAKLRLSCSVLSFSSQIAGNLPTSSKIAVPITEHSENESNKRSTQLGSDTRSTAQNNVSENSQPTKNVNKNNEKENIDKASTSKVKEDDKTNFTERIIIQNNISCNPLISKQSPLENGTVSIQVWVEDKEATRGPISLRLSRQAIMGELRRQAETSLGLDSRLQRWIIGHTLCLDDAVPLVSLAGPDLSAPFYLCLVEAESIKEPASGSQAHEREKQKTSKNNDNTGEVYTELIKLEQQAIVHNTETFECGVCMEECKPGRGAVLRECIHSFCRDCLSDVVRHCEEPVVGCPFTGCPGILQEREIRALLPTEEYEQWLARGLATAECSTRNAFHCRTRDCSGWALCELGVKKFPCPVCKCNNCVPCQAIHEGETCEQYQTKLRTAVTAAQRNETDEGTQAFLNSLIRRGEALECPECQAVITKKWGCDWVKCSACKTEICWVTRGRRWGPAGRGDTSAGCKCGVDGKRCHPSCGYCH